MTTPNQDSARAADDDGWGDHSWASSPDFDPAPTARAGGAQPGRVEYTQSVRPAAPTADHPVAPANPYDEQALRYAPPGFAVDAAGRQSAGRPGDATGVNAVVALLLLAVVVVVGVAVDKVAGTGAGLRFGLVLGSLLAVLAVRRRSLFAVVVAPPLAFMLGSLLDLCVTAGGLPKRADLLNFATGWLIYGFPTIAVASAVVLVIAALRHRIARWPGLSLPNRRAASTA